MPSSSEEEIQRLLAEHALLFLDEYADKCKCEGLPATPSMEDSEDFIRAHRAHVASVIAAHMADGLERIAIDIETASAINESMFPNAPDYRSGLRTAAQMVRLGADRSMPW